MDMQTSCQILLIGKKVNIHLQKQVQLKKLLKQHQNRYTDICILLTFVYVYTTHQRKTMKAENSQQRSKNDLESYVVQQSRKCEISPTSVACILLKAYFPYSVLEPSPRALSSCESSSSVTVLVKPKMATMLEEQDNKKVPFQQNRKMYFDCFAIVPLLSSSRMSSTRTCRKFSGRFLQLCVSLTICKININYRQKTIRLKAFFKY